MAMVLVLLGVSREVLGCDLNCEPSPCVRSRDDVARSNSRTSSLPLLLKARIIPHSYSHDTFNLSINTLTLPIFPQSHTNSQQWLDVNSLLSEVLLPSAQVPTTCTTLEATPSLRRRRLSVCIPFGTIIEQD
jgi:hypothetical protein